MLWIPTPTLIDAIPITAHIQEAPTWSQTASPTSLTITQPTTTTTPTLSTPTIITHTQSSPTTSIPDRSLITLMCSQVGPGSPNEVMTCQQPDGYVVTAKRVDLLPKDRDYEQGLRDQLCEIKPWFCGEVG